MPIGTRRQFIQKTAFAAAALSGRGLNLRAEALAAFEPLDQRGMSLDPDAIRSLASKIGGRVITTDAPEYESARLVFNRAFDQRPSLIVRCAQVSDAARALEFAQHHELPVAVRGGAHSRAGFGVCNGGVVIDFSLMKRVEVDASRSVARVEAGCLVRDLDQATQGLGLATTSGGCPTVGIAGFTLGGGEGKLMSKYGAACDNLVSATVVTVAGSEVEASQTSNPDLFWAIRGGGGNFGLVTSFVYRLHPVGEVQAGSLTYSAERLPELLPLFARFAREAPDEASVIAEILPSEQGMRFRVHVFQLGSPGSASGLLRPLRSPHKPLEDHVAPMSYFAAQSAGFLPTPFAHFETNLFLPEFNAAAVEVISNAVKDAPPQFRVLIVPLFGAVTRVPSSDMAFALRQPGYEVDMLGSWNTPAERATAERWVKTLRDNLHPFAHGTYVNQLGESSADLVRAAYGSNYDRLVTLKKKYDPTNVLRLNQNIRPA